MGDEYEKAWSLLLPLVICFWDRLREDGSDVDRYVIITEFTTRQSYPCNRIRSIEKFKTSSKIEPATFWFVAYNIFVLLHKVFLQQGLSAQDVLCLIEWMDFSMARLW
jgi:hypothetical protein